MGVAAVVDALTVTAVVVVVVRVVVVNVVDTHLTLLCVSWVEGRNDI